mmetsp:Transcript_71826/g.124715  ORF Transcript_71826/g.124715 Transcript_71826/m.124715 type:complete len:216 (+) Transcript_71826:261-908(+)
MHIKAMVHLCLLQAICPFLTCRLAHRRESTKSPCHQSASKSKTASSKSRTPAAKTCTKAAAHAFTESQVNATSRSPYSRLMACNQPKWSNTHCVHKCRPSSAECHSGPHTWGMNLYRNRNGACNSITNLWPVSNGKPPHFKVWAPAELEAKTPSTISEPSTVSGACAPFACSAVTLTTRLSLKDAFFTPGAPRRSATHKKSPSLTSAAGTGCRST